MALAFVLAVWSAFQAALWYRDTAVGLPPAAPGPARLIPDVNHAPARHLILLPRVGPARAAAILETRSREGPFDSLEDLQRVKGIGPVTVAGLEGLARAGP